MTNTLDAVSLGSVDFSSLIDPAAMEAISQSAFGNPNSIGRTLERAKTSAAL